MAVMYSFCRYFSVRLGSVLVAVSSLILKMAVMYSFCRYFSVRLGSVLVAVSSLIQSLLFGCLCLVWLYKSAELSDNLEEWSSTKKLIYVTHLVKSMELNTTIYLKSAILFLMIHTGACVLLIYAALKCRVPLAWPFVVAELVRLGALSFGLVTATALVKENVLDLGTLIAVTLTGGFTLLLLYYKWFCVLSLCQCIRELELQGQQQEKHSSNNKPAVANYLTSDFNHLTSRFSTSHAQPVRRLPHSDLA